ncbi:MAG: acylphosphatase [Geobacteraceae bacterium]|nr:acylphosphatase [Geobacteraceae bacterium]
MNARVRIVVHGLVQGVSFRYHTSRRALELGVAGWVRNLPDGTVEALLEGNDSAVQALLEWCRLGPAAARVDRLDVSREPYTGEFRSFTVTG